MDLYTVQETVLQLQGQIESDCELIPAHEILAAWTPAAGSYTSARTSSPPSTPGSLTIMAGSNTWTRSISSRSDRTSSITGATAGSTAS